MTSGQEHLRSYVEGDETKILELFEVVFKRKMSLNFWNWRFKNNPWAHGIITLAWDKDVLAGHYAVMPFQIQVQNLLIKAVFSMTTMTHPKYRGRGLFPRLAKRTYERARELGYKLVYGFPNAFSHRGFVNRLNWFDLGNVSLNSVEPVKTSEALKDARSNIISEKITLFSENVNQLWESTKSNFIIAIPRNTTFLNWRFAKHPETKYSMHLLKNENGELEGYYVLKIYEYNGHQKGHIVDYLLKDNHLFRDLLVFASDFFKSHEIQDLSFWMSRGLFNQLATDIKEIIKRTSMPEVFFGGLLFESFDGASFFQDLNNYYITMADSDVF